MRAFFSVKVLQYEGKYFTIILTERLYSYLACFFVIKIIVEVIQIQIKFISFFLTPSAKTGGVSL